MAPVERPTLELRRAGEPPIVTTSALALDAAGCAIVIDPWSPVG